MFIGVPTSSQLKKNDRLHHKITKNIFDKNTHTLIKQTQATALIGQMRIFDTKRIINYHYKINKQEFSRIQDKVARLFSPSDKG